MGSAGKKQQKGELKRAKKEAKARIKAGKAGAPTAPAAPPETPRPSPAVRYAELVRGALYVLLGASLVVALILGERGAIVSLDDLIESLFVRAGGKLVLALIAVAMFIYGLKHLRLVR